MERLSKALNDHKGEMSLRELARRLDVSPTTAEAWLKGWRTPGFENVHRIASELGEEDLEVAAWILEELRLKKGPSEAPIIHVLSAPWAGRPTDNRPPARKIDQTGTRREAA